MIEGDSIKPRSSLSVGEYAVLGVLGERPMHGYEIARRFAADLDLGLVLPLDMSSVYALLKDLQEQGLIEGHRETVGLRPPRTVFHLTPDAAAVLLQWLEEPVGRLREVRSDLLLKLYFCRAIGDACTARLLDAQIGASRSYLDRIERLALECPHGSFERLVRESKIGAARATVAWLQEERSRLGG
ncbi:MAG: helix-turn-helix transcriptional regulator [Chloroflexi bacterium]|nr:helix-turn-helix transcriptional regulator [Chloroflexota bacterium]